MKSPVKMNRVDRVCRKRDKERDRDFSSALHPASFHSPPPGASSLLTERPTLRPVAHKLFQRERERERKRGRAPERSSVGGEPSGALIGYKSLARINSTISQSFRCCRTVGVRDSEEARGVDRLSAPPPGKECIANDPLKRTQT